MLDPEEFEETMTEISRTFMPFGKYGPDNYPPSGVPIYDLPFEVFSTLNRTIPFC